MDLLDFLFPRKCFSCKREQGTYLCVSCARILPRAKIHAHPKPFDKVFSIWKYDGPIKKAITEFKYNFAYKVGEDLGGRASFELKKIHINFQNFVLVPIPLHQRRMKERGFNQAEEVAKVIAKRFHLRLETSVLVRTKQTTPQARHTKKERLRNISGIFAVNPEVKRIILNNNVILFDDVWTTGSTMREACRVLKKEGAKRVVGITLAR